MVPKLIRRKLSGLRWRERGLRLSWRSVLWLVLAVTAVVVAFAVDWIVDLREEVPAGLRVGLVAWEISMAVLAVLVLAFWPWSRRLDDDGLALFVEGKKPELGHRLISTVQLNRPKADTRGMSPALIQRLTDDTVQTVKPMSFAGLADHRWLLWSACVAIPMVLGVAGVFLLMPETAMALLNRQLGGDDIIPRRVQIHSVAFDRKDKMFDVRPDQPLVRAMNDDVVLYFVATGMGVPEQSRGEVKLTPEEGPTRYFPLTFDHTLPDGRSLYAAKVPAPAASFDYRAWLDDGRTRVTSGVRMEPRPAVTRLEAVVQMPKEYQLTPDTKPMKDGDVIGLKGSQALVTIMVQPGKQLESATLEVLGKPLPQVLPVLRGGLGLGPNPVSLATDLLAESAAHFTAAQLAVSETASKKDMGPEFVREPRPMLIEDNFAFAAFPVIPGTTGYRLRVTDQYGFENVDVPRRSVQIVEDELPTVELLPERLGNTYTRAKRPEAIIDDGFAVANDPDNPDRTIRLAYRCTDDYGLTRAQLRYRHLPRGLEFQQQLAEVEPEFVIGPGFGLTASTPLGSPLGKLAETVAGLGVMNSQSMKATPGDWIPLPLVEYKRPVAGPDVPDVGQFDLELGVFEHVKDFKTAQINFHAVPATENSGQWGRLEGGGRFDFHINSVQNLQPGDRLEFFVEVFDNHPDTAKNRREPGRSDSRMKVLVTEAEFQVAMKHREEQERKLRDLEKKQGDVFMTPRKP